MRSHLLTPLILLWALGGALAAAPPRRADPGLVVEGDTLTVVTKLPFKVVAPAGASDYTWTAPPSWKYTEGEHSLNVTAAPEGSYVVGLRTLTVDFEAKKVIRKAYSLQVNVGKVTPPDPGPNPPPPDPDNPDPFSQPQPGRPGGSGSPMSGGKLKASGLRVLMVFDPAKKSTYPQGQLDILTGGEVRDYLEAKCAPDPRVPTWKAYRIWPDGVDASGEDKLWQKAFARPRKALPWLLIGNGSRGYEGPLPADVPAALALLRKFGG